MGSRAFTHFNTEDYEGVGRSVSQLSNVRRNSFVVSVCSRYFCETLLDHQDPCPLKDALRLKILTRLTREGSTADEPANIALSDYSSLSSAELSTTEEVCRFPVIET